MVLLFYDYHTIQSCCSGEDKQILTLQTDYFHADNSGQPWQITGPPDILTIPEIKTIKRGFKFYELNNHLGNVIATVSDMRIPINDVTYDINGNFVSNTPDNFTDYFMADVTQINDYFPFGMLIPGRNYNANSYRFGFQNQEKDDEIFGSTGTSYTAQFWQYDSRIGRRWNLDPKPQITMSDYACFSNNPIWFNDVLGDTTYQFNKKGNYLGMADTDINGIRGVIGSMSKVKDADGNMVDQFNPERNFNFNDPSTDRKQLNSLTIGEKGITFVSDENINWVMNSSDIKQQSFLGRWDFAGVESFGGRMDFNLNYTLPSQGYYSNGDVKEYDNVGGFMLFDNDNAYNLNDAGQFLWGQAMNRLGFEYSSAKIGSETFARGYEFEWDSQADQRAIRQGFFYKTKLKKASAGPFGGLDDWSRRPRRR